MKPAASNSLSENRASTQSEDLASRTKSTIRSRVRRFYSNREKPLTPRSLTWATAFHVVSLGTVGLIFATNVSLAGDIGKSKFMTFANLASRPLQNFSQETDESVIEDDEESFEEELAELDWVVEPEIDESLSEPETEPAETAPESDWVVMPSRLYPQKRKLEPAPLESVQEAAASEPVAPSETVEEPSAQASVPDVQPLLLEATPPKYPSIARRKGWEGSAHCLIQVGTDGLVLSARIETSSGYDVLDQAALAAVSGWRFKPGERNGASSEFELLHKVTFRLES